jgi:hypothetical protein
MASDFVQVAPDSTGKKVQCFENAGVETQAVVVVDPTGVPVSPLAQGLTDTQLRATAVPVSGPLTNTQLRAAAVPVSAAALPLPSGAAKEDKQDTGNTSLAAIASAIASVHRTASASVATSNGSVAGVQSVQFIPSADFTGTLLGQAWPSTNAPVGFSVNGADNLDTIAYTITTGSILIYTIS